jgi:hypothetical protein
MEKKKRGGARKGSGAKPKLINPVTIIFTIEKNVKEAARNKHGILLNDLFRAWIEKI